MNLDPVPPDWSMLVPRLSGRRVLVIGDVMLDDYLAGDTHRMCPEAPVPIVDLEKRWSVPGGAANAAANVASLGGCAILGGVMGGDEGARSLERAIRATGVDPAGLLADPGRRTTIKMRAIARGQQVLRIDSEDRTPLSENLSAQLAHWAEAVIPEVDAVLLSDYGKGVVKGLSHRVIATARRHHKPLVIDPKGSDSGCYRGATVIKPNLNELSDLVGNRIATHEDLLEAGERLAEQHPGTAILVTRGSDGMMLIRSESHPVVIAASPSSRLFDVTGAGDTVAAILTLGLAAGLPLELSARLASVAAGIAVGKLGTAVVQPAEILSAL